MLCIYEKNVEIIHFLVGFFSFEFRILKTTKKHNTVLFAILAETVVITVSREREIDTFSLGYFFFNSTSTILVAVQFNKI